MCKVAHDLCVQGSLLQGKTEQPNKTCTAHACTCTQNRKAVDPVRCSYKDNSTSCEGTWTAEYTISYRVCGPAPMCHSQGQALQHQREKTRQAASRTFISANECWRQRAQACSSRSGWRPFARPPSAKHTGLTRTSTTHPSSADPALLGASLGQPQSPPLSSFSTQTSRLPP